MGDGILYMITEMEGAKGCEYSIHTCDPDDSRCLLWPVKVQETTRAQRREGKSLNQMHTETQPFVLMMQSTIHK